MSDGSEPVAEGGAEEEDPTAFVARKDKHEEKPERAIRLYEQESAPYIGCSGGGGCEINLS